MKAILQKVPLSTDSSFAVQRIKGPYFNVPWHFHPEYELVLVLESQGKKFIGNNISDFKAGSLVLLGSNLPHWYRNDDIYYQQSRDLQAVSLVVQFSQSFLEGTFLALPEGSNIRNMLVKASMGLEITGQTRARVSGMLHELCNLTEMDRLLHLLSILNTVAKSSEYEVLSLQGTDQLSIEDSQRINTIYQFVMDNFTEDISSEKVSGVVNMCTSAFCRYFKKRTRKTFTSFLNEIRIGHACKLLIEEDVSISDVCFMSGFNNLSNFNRQFMVIKGISPKTFRNEYLSSKKN